MDRTLQTLMVTGGSGFIGTNFIRFLFSRPDFDGRILNVDKLTYAGNPHNLADLEERYGAEDGGGARYLFAREDIRDAPKMEELIRSYEVDTVVNFAAESHVDRSVHGPQEFIATNINGTFSLIEAARKVWGENSCEGKLFHQVSTDEVFGSLGPEGRFTEESRYDPRSPYSASKAAADHLVRAAHHTYGLPVTISNCSNNYGPYQFPEKLIPLMLLNMREGKRLPIYGDGSNVRDWLYVEDHADAIWLILMRGCIGESYNLGGDSEKDNLTLVRLLCDLMAERTGVRPEEYRSLITYVKDRPGHDRRYAMDNGKISAELGWRPKISFSEGIDKTIAWYLSHDEWIEGVRSGEYRKWIEKNYRLR